MPEDNTVEDASGPYRQPSGKCEVTEDQVGTLAMWTRDPTGVPIDLRVYLVFRISG